MRSYYHIAVLPLEWGGEWGCVIKGVFLNRKCRTLEYLLNARLNTLTSFGELVETREKVLHCFCKVCFSKIHTCLERNKYKLSSKHFYGSRTLTL